MNKEMPMIRLDTCLYWITIICLLGLLLTSSWYFTVEGNRMQQRIDDFEQRYFTMDNMSMDDEGKIVLQKEVKKQ